MMRSYICYVHTPSKTTPHMRILNADTKESFAEALQELISEWPGFEAVDVYDEADRLVLRMAADDRSRLVSL